MASYTGRAWVGTGTYSVSGTVYSTGWTVPSTITNSCTFNIVIRGTLTDYNTTNDGYLRTSKTYNNTSDYYICDSAGNNAIKIQSFNINGVGSKTSNNNPVTINPRSLAGKVLYMKEVATGGDGVHMFGDCAFTITYNTYTNCTAPTTVSVSRSRSVCTVSWSGASNGTNNNITNYKIIVNSSASESGATELGASPATSSPVTTQPNGTTPTTSKDYYFGVRSQAPYNNSAYKWSSKVTVPAKPSVSSGDVITDTQMDNLRVWIGGTGITDIADGGDVKASEGNTYRSGLTAGTSKVEASWYNAASTG